MFSIINDIVGIIFIVSLIIIYIPQFHKIVKYKSSRGFNPWFMFFGHTRSFWTMSNTLVYYINGWWTCHGTKECGESFLGFGLVIVQWMLFFIMYIMYLKYLHDPNASYYKNYQVSHRQLAYLTFFLSILLGMMDLVINLVLLWYNNWHNPVKPSSLTLSTSIFEILILVFFLVHYVPQIWTTYKLQDAGSISLLTLSLMCPGTFLWTIYLALQGKFVHMNADAGNPIVWVPYLVVGTMQGVLLGMGVYYERKKRKRLYLLSINDDDNIEDLSLPITNSQVSTVEIHW